MKTNGQLAVVFVAALAAGASFADMLTWTGNGDGELNHYGMYWLRWSDVRR